MVQELPEPQALLVILGLWEQQVVQVPQVWQALRELLARVPLAPLVQQDNRAQVVPLAPLVV